MPTRNAVRASAYFDSLVLMSVAARLEARPDVEAASLMMATPVNLALLREAGLLTADGEAAGPNDLVIAVQAPEAMLDELVAEADASLARSSSDEPALAARVPRTIHEASLADPELNLALISTPGAYASAEALKALRRGMHVFLFSDNVPLEQEVALKAEAARRDLLVMGPDCGTAIVNGFPLGFANVLRRGHVGLAGASGTGLQMVSCLVHRGGAGVSQVVGVGGRDLSAEVGGRSMLYALDALAGDPETEVIVLVSKPPAPAVAGQVLQRAERAGKPVVVCFLGSVVEERDNVHPASTLAEAAQLALQLQLTGVPVTTDDAPRRRLAGERRLVRGLYAGGTFAYEARLLMAGLPDGVDAHAEHYVPGRLPVLPDRHLVLDLGDDEYTIGRPHPMIDPTVRLEFLRAAGADPRTAVIVLDVVLGHGAADDPAGALAPVLETIDGPEVVAFICGTELDPQDLRRQEERLRRAGVTLVTSSTAAARLAAGMVAAEAFS